MTQFTSFTVTGRGRFPIDMLRYDGAYPSHATDAADLQGSLGDDPFNPISTANREPWEITLVSIKRPGIPSIDRWASFMVKVILIDGVAP